MYVYVYMYVCVYVCIYIYMHARVGVHMHSCRRILFILYCSISLLYARESQVLLNTCMCVRGEIGGGFCFNLFMVSACCWRGRLCFGRGRNRGFCLVYFSILRVSQWCVCVCLYTRVYTNKLLGTCVKNQIIKTEEFKHLNIVRTSSCLKARERGTSNNATDMTRLQDNKGHALLRRGETMQTHRRRPGNGRMKIICCQRACHEEVDL